MNKLFTLIEMVIVTVVISILTAIVIPNISSLQKEASTSAITSNIRNIQTSVDMYRLENQDSLPVDDVTIFNPKVIDFDKLNPNHLRNMPETKGVTYWIDFRGIVWGSRVVPIQQ